MAGRGEMKCTEGFVLMFLNGSGPPLPDGTTIVGIDIELPGAVKIWRLTIQSDLLDPSDEPHKNVIIDWTKEEDTGKINLLGIRKDGEGYAEKYGA